MELADEEPEKQVPQRTPPPVKKPMSEFLAEFEQRLAAGPDEPATDAYLEVEARAEGARRRPSALPAGAPASVEEAPVSDPSTAADETALPASSAGEAASPAAEKESIPRRLRGRRRRRHRR